MKKGFTLVELLAVIVILSLITLIAGVGITRITKRAKSDLSDAEKLAIIHAAEAWSAENIDLLPTSDNSCIQVALNDLKTSKLLNDISKNVYDKNAFVKICYSSKEGASFSNYTYEIVEGE